MKKPGEGTYVNKYGATTKRTGGYIQDIDCTVLSEDETATFSDMTLVLSPHFKLNLANPSSLIARVT